MKNTNVFRNKSAHRLLLLLACLFLGASTAHAASVSIVPQAGPLSAGTPFVVTVSLTTDSNSVNAVDGNVTIPAGIEITNVSTGNSAITLWPVTPVYVVTDHEITFTGGTPGGLAQNTSNMLFTFTAVANQAGSYTFSSADTHTYKNDGTGTETALSNASINLSVGEAGKSASPAITAVDHTPPVFTAVGIGRDPSLFGDKYFATFFATDAGSGVDHYEVQEGPLAPFVRAERYYVLQDQTLGTPVTVEAIDKDGNIATIIIPAAHPHTNTLAYVVLGIVIAILIVMVYFVRKRK